MLLGLTNFEPATVLDKSLDNPSLFIQLFGSGYILIVNILESFFVGSGFVQEALQLFTTQYGLQ